MSTPTRIALAGSAAGIINGVLLRFHFSALQTFAPPVFPFATILYGAWHGLWLAFGIWWACQLAEKLTEKDSLRILCGGLGGMIGSLVGGLFFTVATGVTGVSQSILAYILMWGLGFGFPIGLGITLPQAAFSETKWENKSGQRVLMILGASFGGGIAWGFVFSTRWNSELFPIGLLHGAIFGLCFVTAVYFEQKPEGRGHIIG